MTSGAILRAQSKQLDLIRLTRTGLALAASLVVVWTWALVTGLAVLELRGWGLLIAPALVALQCWLFVGLFIVAHDAMHGSLAPRYPRLNAWIGRVCLLLYAGFSYDQMREKHFAHHDHSGTELDPDFDADHPSRFWPWYLTFMRRYFGMREFMGVAAMTCVLALTGAPLANILVFWALPSILSSMQLFLFGTYLPHRLSETSFADRHNARSSDYPIWLSLLTCFHFGYHHAHHLHPGTPWWRLPDLR